MSKSLHTPFLASALCALPLVIAAPAQALEAGDWLVRGAVGYIDPQDDSDELSGVPGGEVDVGDSTSLAFNLTWMATNNIGVELLGSLPFKHEIDGAGTLDGAGTVAEAKHLPPTLLAVYQFTPQAKWRPYVGLGLNYTLFFDEQGRGVLDGTDVELDNSWGVAVEAGLDVDINDRWFANASLWWMDIDTTADTAVGEVDVEIDPIAVLVGVGYRF